MSKSVVIIGASGFGREVLWLIERINDSAAEKWEILGFIDDDESLQGKSVNGYDVIGTLDSINQFADSYFVCAIGNAKTRKKIIEKIHSINDKIKFCTLIDPDVTISNLVDIGEGTIICAGSIVTVNIKIGKHCIVNLDCTIGHDAIIEDYVTMYPSVNVSGAVSIGELCELGTGAQIIQGINICSSAIIGAGTVIVKSIDESGTYVGAPAKRIK
ncbi:MAG: acetyltransferase [Ruminococcaceae bacterium]|nr:acetyltransferase [Oscillospiraceae bacterium]